MSIQSRRSHLEERLIRIPFLAAKLSALVYLEIKNAKIPSKDISLRHLQQRAS